MFLMNLKKRCGPVQGALPQKGKVPWPRPGISLRQAAWWLTATLTLLLWDLGNGCSPCVVAPEEQTFGAVPDPGQEGWFWTDTSVHPAIPPVDASPAPPPQTPEGPQVGSSINWLVSSFFQFPVQGGWSRIKICVQVPILPGVCLILPVL